MHSGYKNSTGYHRPLAKREMDSMFHRIHAHKNHLLSKSLPWFKPPSLTPPSKPWRNRYKNHTRITQESTKESTQESTQESTKESTQESTNISWELLRIDFSYIRHFNSEQFLYNHTRKCRLTLAESSFCQKKRLFIFSDFFRFLIFMKKSAYTTLTVLRQN